MAKGKIAKKSVSDSGVVFTFADDRQIVVNVADLSQDMIHRAAIHGLSQKIGDSYAGAESVDEAYQYAQETVEALTKGDWTTRTEGAGGPRVTMLVEALYRATKHEGKTLEDAQALIASMTDEQLTGMRKVAPIAAALAEIAAERALEKAQKAKEAAAGKALDLSSIGL